MTNAASPTSIMVPSHRSDRSLRQRLRQRLRLRLRQLLTSTCLRPMGIGTCLSLALLAPAMAGPDGGKVVGGKATITTSGRETTINQKSNRALIEWDRFNLDAGEAVRFQQPGRKAITVNRVTGNGASTINGEITAKGNVWLLNPNGVLIGSSAVIDVGGFLATTSDLHQDDFMAGQYRFDTPSTNPDAKVVNEGRITVRDKGLAGLVAPHVRNDGVIEGRLSTVIVAGAQTYGLDLYGDGMINFEVGQPVDRAPDEGAIVENSGRISAPGGRVLVTAQAAAEVVADVIYTDGVIEAQTIERKAGSIVLGSGQGTVEVTGRVDASGAGQGESGGSIDIIGETVVVREDARIDVSGQSGAGSVEIGGSFQGDGPLPNAQRTYVGPDAEIRADALEDGDGGEVIVWADGQTVFAGEASARGGPEGGDGGFVEVSGKEILNFVGMVDIAAPEGNAGTLLLDPGILEVVDQLSVQTVVNDTDPSIDALFLGIDVGEGGVSQVETATLEAIPGNVVVQADDVDILGNLNFNSPETQNYILFYGENTLDVQARVSLDSGSAVLGLASPEITIFEEDNGGSTISWFSEVDSGADVVMIGGEIFIFGEIDVSRSQTVSIQSWDFDLPDLDLIRAVDAPVVEPLLFGPKISLGPTGDLPFADIVDVDDIAPGFGVDLFLDGTDFFLPSPENTPPERQITINATNSIEIDGNINSDSNDRFILNAPRSTLTVREGDEVIIANNFTAFDTLTDPGNELGADLIIDASSSNNRMVTVDEGVDVSAETIRIFADGAVTMNGRLNGGEEVAITAGSFRTSGGSQGNLAGIFASIVSFFIPEEVDPTVGGSNGSSTLSNDFIGLVSAETLFLNTTEDLFFIGDTDFTQRILPDSNNVVEALEIGDVVITSTGLQPTIAKNNGAALVADTLLFVVPTGTDLLFGDGGEGFVPTEIDRIGSLQIIESFLTSEFGTFEVSNMGPLALGALGAVEGGRAPTFDLSAVDLFVQTVDGTLTLDTPITTTGEGESLVLSTDTGIVNNAGTVPFSTPNGRYVLYSVSPEGDTLGSFEPVISPDIGTIETVLPASVTPTDESVIVYQDEVEARPPTETPEEPPTETPTETPNETPGSPSEEDICEVSPVLCQPINERTLTVRVPSGLANIQAMKESGIQQVSALVADVVEGDGGEIAIEMGVLLSPLGLKTISTLNAFGEDLMVNDGNRDLWGQIQQVPQLQ